MVAQFMRGIDSPRIKISLGILWGKVILTVELSLANTIESNDRQESLKFPSVEIVNSTRRFENFKVRLQRKQMHRFC